MAPFTVNSMPDATLLAFADQGEVGDGMSSEQSSGEDVIQQFAESGIDVDALGVDLQNSAKSFVKSWTELMDIITAKAAELARADKQGARG
jgi:transaldolase